MIKIAALYPVGNNEEKFLEFSLASVAPIVDEIIALFDYPIDNESKINSKFLLEKYQSKIYYLNQHNSRRNSNAPRKKLLEIARKEKITHFIWLDCDEFFCSNFTKNGRENIKKLLPGEKLFLRWVNLWDDYNMQRVDKKSVWSNLYKDFIVCDHPGYTFEDNLHENRTQSPVQNRDKLSSSIGEGLVFHTQFLAWKNCQYKQAWYMLREKKNTKEKTFKINNKYFQSQNYFRPHYTKIDEILFNHINIKNLKEIKNVDNIKFWKKNFRDFFKENDIDQFLDLNIWHLPELKKIYQEIKKKAVNR